MRIKDLFTIPENEKVTEKVFARVLISSVCSIVLCMACLFGTTWAWFTADIENTENQIQIATVTEKVKVTGGGERIDPADDGSYALDAGTYDISIALEQLEESADDANLLSDSKRPVYVIMAIKDEGSVTCQSFEFASKEDVKKHQLTIGSGSAAVSFCVAWVMPVGAPPAGDETVVAGVLQSPSAAEPSTEATTTPVTEPETRFTESDQTDTTTVADEIEAVA